MTSGKLIYSPEGRSLFSEEEAVNRLTEIATSIQSIPNRNMTELVELREDLEHCFRSAIHGKNEQLKTACEDLLESVNQSIDSLSRMMPQ